jgi:hypothetical protein
MIPFLRQGADSVPSNLWTKDTVNFWTLCCVRNIIEQTGLFYIVPTTGMVYYYTKSQHGNYCAFGQKCVTITDGEQNRTIAFQGLTEQFVGQHHD